MFIHNYAQYGTVANVKQKKLREVYAKYLRVPSNRVYEIDEHLILCRATAKRTRAVPEQRRLLCQRRHKSESQKYTGDYVIGIATMHKSNAVRD